MKEHKFYKLAKEIVRLGKWVRHYGNNKEIRDATDPETKNFIRPKRNVNHLPCYDNTGTRFIDISKFKNWKNRSKVKHQWEDHNKSSKELNTYEDQKWNKDQLLYKLKKLDGRWFHVPITKIYFDKHKENFYCYVDPLEGALIEELVNEHQIDGEWKEFEISRFNYKTFSYNKKKYKLLIKVRMI